MARVDCIERSKIGSCDGGTIKRCIASSIPEEIVFDILIWLPADVIYNVMRYVCRMWYNIIRSSIFISSHLKKSTTALFIQRYATPKSSYVVKIPKCANVEVDKLKFQLVGIALASCNGLVLLFDGRRLDTLYVVNPVTKQQLALPAFDGKYPHIRYGFAYVDSSKVYKVVFYFGSDLGCGILTLGVDKAWRFLDMSHVTSTIDHSFWSSSISLGGFVYWANLEVPFVLRLNVETEIFQQIPLPQGCEDQALTFLAMGSCLSVMSIIKQWLWEVWLLMDPETGKWIKLPDVNLEVRVPVTIGSVTLLRPVGWLQNGELLVLHIWPDPLGNWIVYNVKTGGTHSFELNSSEIPYSRELWWPHAHVNSLVPLNNFSLPCLDI